MPHLSPMNWLLAISLFWTILLSISSSHWWSQPMKFPSAKKMSSSSMTNSWKWSL